jgi:hypothetical protein
MARVLGETARYVTKQSIKKYQQGYWGRCFLACIINSVRVGPIFLPPGRTGRIKEGLGFSL